MKKKYIILVLTFLCILCGQMSYGQGVVGDVIYDLDGSLMPLPEQDPSNEGIELYEVIVTGGYHSSGGWDLEDIVQQYIQDHPDYSMPSDYGNPDDFDLCDYFPDLCDYLTDAPCTTTCSNGFTLNSACECECTTTCSSGYVLIEETCECQQLPPCFGSANSSGNTQTSPIIEEISAILNGLGIGGDAKAAVIALAGSGDDLAPFANYLTQLTYISRSVGGASAAVSLDNYTTNPTTQNLLQFIFDTAAFALTFSTGPAAPFVSFAASFSNATGATSYVLGNLGDLIDQSVDCNVGEGIYNVFSGKF